MIWLPRGHGQETSGRFSKLLLNSEPVEFLELFIFRVLRFSICLQAGTVCAKAALQIEHQLPARELSPPSPRAAAPRDMRPQGAFSSQRIDSRAADGTLTIL